MPVGKEPSEQLSSLPGRYCPVCERTGPAVFLPGPAGRPDASCPHCRSLERHRFLAILLACLQPTLGDLGTLLDVAPSAQVTPLLERLNARTHIRFDLGADNRLVDCLGSLTDLPLADNSVDLIVCYHVLEHVPDDRRAMREIARVLSPGGLAILQVPWRPATVTDEDPDAPPEERIRRFGQVDHVRYYGLDFEDRLVESGLSFERVTPRAVLGEVGSGWMKLQPNETSWIAVADDRPHKPYRQLTGTSLARTFDTLLAETAAQHAAVAREKEKAKELRAKLARATRVRRKTRSVARRLLRRGATRSRART